MSEPSEPTCETSIGLTNWLPVVLEPYLTAPSSGLSAERDVGALLPLFSPPFIKLFNFFLSPWEIKCQCRAGTSVALWNRGCSPQTERSHSLRRWKLSAARWWPASFLRGNCAFDWLNERLFPSLHYTSFVAVLSSAVQQAEGCVFEPSALTDTDTLRGSQVNKDASVFLCGGFFFFSYLLILNCLNARASHQLSWLWIG